MLAWTILNAGETPVEAGDIECPYGKMFVDDDGIRVYLNGENGVFTGCLPWKMAPQGLAMLRIASDYEAWEEGEYSTEILNTINEKLEAIGVDRDDIEHFIGECIYSIQTTDSLLGAITSSWHLSERCPWASLHNELERVRSMSYEDLVQYTELALG